MNTGSEITGKTGLPLVRLSLLNPFLLNLDANKIDADSILRDYGLNREAMASPDVFVPAMTIYKVLEAMALAANNPYLAVHVGEVLNLTAWPVFTDSVKYASSFGDFFFRFAAESVNQASSVQMCLDTDGKYATFRAHRVFEPTIVPAQSDAFYVGLFTTIFRNCTGDNWNPREVLVRLSDPSAVPPGYYNLMISRGDRRGPSIRFPQQWLLFPIQINDLENHSSMEVDYQSPPRSLNDAIRQALQPHLHRTDLTTELAANICGYDKRVLARKLKTAGTTLTKEISTLKAEQAMRLLKETSLSIAEVGNAVGFSDPAIFSRAFKKWASESPRQFRNRYRMPS
jgi:AraC-like DNA-binding protein